MGISNKSLHDWIKVYGQPLDVDNASAKELAARVRQLERQLAMREGQIEVLKKAIGIVSRTRRTVRDDPAGETNSDLSVTAWCEALEVSASGYYARCQRDNSPRQQADARLGAEIERVFADSRCTYGSHRVWLMLRERGIRTSRKRVERLMRERGLRSIRARKRRAGLTKAGQSTYFAPNLLKQDFHATRRNEKWVTDTTYIPTCEGWLYLVSVMDLFSRQVGNGNASRCGVGNLGAGHGDTTCAARSRIDRPFGSGHRVGQC